MAKNATRISDVKVKEWTDSIGTGLIGLGVMLAAGLLMYSVKFWIPPGGLALATRILMGVGVLGGAGILGTAIYRSVEANKAPGVPYPCPYCDSINMFTETPVGDFDCEACDRTVHFEHGAPIPVRTIICQACRTEHRVAINVQRYVCDRCNRPLRLAADPTQKLATATDDLDALLMNYDVLLLAHDRRQENELAMKLQNLMVVNLKESRRMMLAATSAKPLVVSSNQPQRKAEAIRRSLQELGATVTIRPSVSAASATARPGVAATASSAQRK